MLAHEICIILNSYQCSVSVTSNGAAPLNMPVHCSYLGCWQVEALNERGELFQALVI